MSTTIRLEDALEQPVDQVEQDNTFQALAKEHWARIELTPEVLGDVGRFFDHIVQYNPGAAPGRIGGILDALQTSPTARCWAGPCKAACASW